MRRSLAHLFRQFRQPVQSGTALHFDFLEAFEGNSEGNLHHVVAGEFSTTPIDKCCLDRKWKRGINLRHHGVINGPIT
jgi:hypothetical protein